MNFELSEEQQMLKDSARGFLEKECTESVVRESEDSDSGYSPELWKKAAELGWLGIAYPEKYGGSGMDILDMAILYEEMGRALFPSPHLSTVVLGGLTILDAGSEEQKNSILPRISKGEMLLSLAVTEPEAIWNGKGWLPEGVTMPVVAQGDDYILSGTKLFVHDAHSADYLIVAAATGKENKITLFLVEAHSPGITYTILRTSAGDKRQSEIIFDDVKVPGKNIIGRLHDGWAPLEKILKIGAVLLSAQLVGSAEKAMELAIDHAKTRIQFDMPIGIHNWVQEYCIMAFADVQGTRNLVYEAAWMLGKDIPCDLEVAMAKARANEACIDAHWQAHQVLAGIGFCTQDGLLPLHTKRGKVYQLYLGDTDHHMEKIAQQLEKWPDLEKPHGKPLGIFDVPEDLQEPNWDVWKNQIEVRGKLW
ncbi:MAG: acyl-CoA/acyl-ACP dehydrogenase [Syntrophales bacterium]|jgi:alkylation response protein AidB-like acyl-CoA dehydrogenase|nr:acyl-CoA/acyl-ACP dehydrogenase [Syntrophales bacterium]MDY0045221.1 acyl-CoA dehydrogenase family protein [Syntrophales bacterium]